MAARFDESLVSRVQQASDIVGVISEHLALSRKGREMVGLCPFHKDMRPSLYVNPVKQIFKCFACGAGGTVFTFVQLRENLTFPQAVERLAHRAGIEVKAIVRSGNQSGGGMSSQSLAKLNAWAMSHWQGCLNDRKTGSAARDYVQRRSISPESVAKWSVGFAPDAWTDLINAAAQKKVPAKALVEGGLAVRRSQDEQGLYDRFRNRLMFPITDVTGRVLGFGGRTLGDDPAKYMNSPATPLFDKSSAVYGLQQARHAVVSCGTAVVVEGYMDCLMCHQFGIENVVATLGTSFTAAQAHLLRRYANKIVLLFDSDTAGAAASSRALEICLTEGIDIKLAFVPQGKDPCDYLLAAGEGSLRAIIENAQDVMEFKWSQLKEGLKAGDTLAQQAAATREFVRTLAAGLRAGKVDSLTRGLIVNRVAGLTGLSARRLEDEIASSLAALERSASYRTQNSRVVSLGPVEGWHAKAQQEVVEVLLNEPGLMPMATEQISLADFDVPALKEIMTVLLADEGGSPSMVEILSRIESPETASLTVGLQQEGERKANYRQRLVEAVGAIRDGGKSNRHNAVMDEDERLKSIT
ncbi:MAG TPA: DNA primase, partial [Sedimentisphaerales bacterium]|nr:DNA primase [Sedimentisphaerales bacterium]